MEPLLPVRRPVPANPEAAANAMESQLARLNRKREAIQLRWQLAATAVTRVDTRFPIQDLEAQLLRTNFHNLYKQLYQYNRIIGMLPGAVVNPGRAPTGMLPFTPPQAGGPAAGQNPPEQNADPQRSPRMLRRVSPRSPSMMSPVGRRRLIPARPRPVPHIPPAIPMQRASASPPARQPGPLAGRPQMQNQVNDPLHTPQIADLGVMHDEDGDEGLFEAEFDSDLEV